MYLRLDSLLRRGGAIRLEEDYSAAYDEKILLPTVAPAPVQSPDADAVAGTLVSSLMRGLEGRTTDLNGFFLA